MSPPHTPPSLSYSPTATPCTTAESTPSRFSTRSPQTPTLKRSEVGHVRRPANPFILFACDYRQKVEHKGKNNRELSRQAGDVWHKMSDADKIPWKMKAAEVKVKHAKEHPDYRYKPRRRSPSKHSRVRDFSIEYEGGVNKSKQMSSFRSSSQVSTDSSPTRLKSEPNDLWLGAPLSDAASPSRPYRVPTAGNSPFNSSNPVCCLV